MRYSLRTLSTDEALQPGLQSRESASKLFEPATRKPTNAAKAQRANPTQDVTRERVTLFVPSGTNFLFDTIEDDTQFRNGQWNDMVLPLKVGNAFDPTSVARIGINMILKPAGSAGNPTAPPTTSVWLDDVWVEK